MAVLLAAPAPPPSRDAGAGTKADQGSGSRARILVIEEVRGDQGTPAARQALREALARHLGRRGFHVVDGGKRFSFRLQPKLLLVEVQNGVSVEVKASVVALDRKGKVAAMVEGGARAKGATAAQAAPVLEGQALEAAARSLSEDLARRLTEAR
jgi:hypothetical protein